MCPHTTTGDPAGALFLHHNNDLGMVDDAPARNYNAEVAKHWEFSDGISAYKRDRLAGSDARASGF